MRVLITNHALDQRAGTELYCRDIALALRNAGHEPWCYSRELGGVADELRGDGIAVWDSLQELPAAPDIIHGHHRLETTVAGLFFPRVPIVSFCHGAITWQEAPCRLPNVAFWVAVDDACRERLIEQEGIAPERVRLLPNFVDTDRFAARENPVAALRRALVFGNAASDSTHLPMVRKACDTLGIMLEVAGVSSGSPAAAPENLLRQHDLVFAKARAAMEAMAAGCAVVLCDFFGAGPLVTPENFDALRAHNFGFHALEFPLSAEHFVSEIGKFDREKTHAVTKRIRSECSLRETLPQLLQLYREAIEYQPQMSSGETAQLAAAFAESELPFGHLGRTVPDLRSQLARLEEYAAHLKQERDRLKSERRKIRDELASLKAAPAHPLRAFWRKHTRAPRG